MSEYNPREFGRLEEKVENIEKTLVNNTKKLDEIHEFVTKQKGAVHVLLMLVTAVSAFVGWAVSYFTK